MTLIEQLRQVRKGKLERVGLLEAGHMQVTIFGIDVSDGTLAQDREEVDLIEAVLGAMGSSVDE